MRNLLLILVRGLCAFADIGCHCAANIGFAYGVFGLDLHMLPITIAIIIIYVFVVMEQFGVMTVESAGAEIALKIAEFALQLLVLVPFFITPEGNVVDLSKTDGSFWMPVIMVAGGIILLQVASYIFNHSKFN